MNYNIIGNPKRVTNSAVTGLPRDVPYVAATAQLWNGSVPCIFVVDGVVRDAHRALPRQPLQSQCGPQFLQAAFRRHAAHQRCGQLFRHR
jgi:hypothetical protein